MRVSEIITIYLAIGAPFGVYYFVQTGMRRNSFKVFFKSLAAIFMFPLFGFEPFRRKFFGKQTRSTNLETNSNSEKLEQLQRRMCRDFIAQSEFALPLQTNLITGHSSLSLFDFREILERYIGLTLALNGSVIDSGFTKPETEIFQIAGRTKEDLQLAARCLHRKNYQRLQVHQIQARRDFLRVLESFDEKNAVLTALDMAKILADDEMQKTLLNLFVKAETGQQNRETANVKQVSSVEVIDVFETERELWKPITSQLPIKPTVFSPNHQTPNSEDTNTRLNALIKLNAEIAREKSLFHTAQEEF